MKKKLLTATILALGLTGLAQPAPPPPGAPFPTPAPGAPSGYREAERANRELARAQYLSGLVAQSPLKATADALLRQAQGEYQGGAYFRAKERARAASLIYEALRFLEVAPRGAYPILPGPGPRRAYEAPFRAQEAIARAEYEANYYRVNRPEVARLVQEAKALLAQGNNLARAEADGLSLEPLELDTLVFTEAEALRPAFRARGVALNLELPEEAVVARANEAALRAIVVSLLENALHHTAKGGQVWVRVDGDGLAVGNAPTHPNPGSGLGLRLARVLAQAQGARLEVAPGSGEFWVRLRPQSGP